MNKIIFGITVLVLTFVASSYAVQSRRITASAGSPIPASYSTNSQSLIVSEMTQLERNITFIATMPNVACRVSSLNSSVAPATPGTLQSAEVFMTASEPVTVKATGRNIFCRGYGGPITSGDLLIMAY